MSELDITIRHERPEDRERVWEIHRAAFGRDVEADLVDALRGNAKPEISLVAIEGGEDDGRIVGHVYLSRVHVGDARRPAMGLAPVGVDPSVQQRDVGGKLCRRGLEECRVLGEPVVFVLGDAAYYPRFGFEPALPRGLYYKSEAFASGFFVAILEDGAADGLEGEVFYHPAFDEA
jgi:putative acetyltransferase